MKKQNRLELIMSLSYVVIVVLCYGIYLRFGKGYSTFQAFQTVMLDVGNFLVILAFGLVKENEANLCPLLCLIQADCLGFFPWLS